MFAKVFVVAEDKEEALKYSKEFEKTLTDCVKDMKLINIEKYWKAPEQYCVEWVFKDVLKEHLEEVIGKLGNKPYLVKDGERNSEYIFAKTIGEIYLEQIEWMFINVD